MGSWRSSQVLLSTAQHTHNNYLDLIAVLVVWDYELYMMDDMERVPGNRMALTGLDSLTAEKDLKLNLQRKTLSVGSHWLSQGRRAMELKSIVFNQQNSMFYNEEKPSQSSFFLLLFFSSLCNHPLTTRARCAVMRALG
ncbi:hypothetical protein NHX12_008255 [Muraenolepis orangiensis]|uniref:Uncharacterized protein n=1 Tax=Muraenolepis orangiensis TaxID=630683 RepID=A0A9Q0DL49_9TELE|nr:hypothetical protein NHX12_008255 [Muraenolepis orangiensis]